MSLAGIFFLCSGQPFSDYYSGKTVKETVGSSINFTWTILRPFTSATPIASKCLFLKTVHFQLYPQQLYWKSVRENYWKSSFIYS